MYLHDWKENGFKQMVQDFENGWYGNDEEMETLMQKDQWKEIDEVLLASYTYEDYEGSAFVLFRKGDKLYEVNGGHCSCYGLEGQWEPEDTNVEALRHRLDKGDFGVYNGWRKEDKRNVFADELREVLNKL